MPGSHDEQGALTAAECAHYREHGWVAIPGLVDESWLERLRAVTHDPRPCLLPPNGPYRPIFAAQQRETERES